MCPRDDVPQLSPAEWEVMKVLWDHGALAARDVFGRLPKRHGWAYKTVKTLLSRLVAKGRAGLRRRSATRISIARRLRRTNDAARKCAAFSERLISEASSPVLAQFIEEADLSDEEIKQLKRLLDGKRDRPSR